MNNWILLFMLAAVNATSGFPQFVLAGPTPAATSGALVEGQAATRSLILLQNKSGTDATVRLTGPSTQELHVPSGQSTAVKVAAGSYYVLVRYGRNRAEYIYSKAGPLAVTETQTQHSEVRITLTRPPKDNPDARHEFETRQAESNPPSSPAAAAGPAQQSGGVSGGYLGIAINGLDDKLARQFELPDTSGALVEDVTADSPADRAGVKPGDVIRKLNGQKVEDADDLTASITGMSPGKTVNLVIFRDGKPISVRVKLGERPANLPVSGRFESGVSGAITLNNRSGTDALVRVIPASLDKNLQSYLSQSTFSQDPFFRQFFGDSLVQPQAVRGQVTTVRVADARLATISIDPGFYYLLVRFGKDPDTYIYSKSEQLLVDPADNLGSGLKLTLQMPASDNPAAHREFEILGQPRPNRTGSPPAPEGPTQRNGPPKRTLRGILVQQLTPDVRDQLGVPAGVRGVAITEVDANTPAGQAGLREGVVIQSINRQPVNSVEDFNRLAAGAKGDVLLRVYQSETGQYFIGISPGDNGGEQ